MPIYSKGTAGTPLKKVPVKLSNGDSLTVNNYVTVTSSSDPADNVVSINSTVSRFIITPSDPSNPNYTLLFNGNAVEVKLGYTLTFSRVSGNLWGVSRGTLESIVVYVDPTVDTLIDGTVIPALVWDKDRSVYKRFTGDSSEKHELTFLPPSILPTRENDLVVRHYFDEPVDGWGIGTTFEVTLPLKVLDAVEMTIEVKISTVYSTNGQPAPSGLPYFESLTVIAAKNEIIQRQINLTSYNFSGVMVVGKEATNINSNKANLSRLGMGFGLGHFSIPDDYGKHSKEVFDEKLKQGAIDSQRICYRTVTEADGRVFFEIYKGKSRGFV